MRENINKVSQRGERLDSLQDKTDNLAVSAQGFRRGANRVRKQMWWKDMKMRVCLVICVIVLLVVIIVPGKLLQADPGVGVQISEGGTMDANVSAFQCPSNITSVPCVSKCIARLCFGLGNMGK